MAISDDFPGAPASRTALSRRRFLGVLPALGAGLAGRVPEPSPPPAPALPVPGGRETFRNWSGEILVPDAWTVQPNVPGDLETLAAWAAARGWRLRPRGMGHGWSPLLLPSGRPQFPTLLVDTRRLDQVWVEARDGAATVTAQAGVTLDRLWEELGRRGLGVAAPPAPGDLTLGGALAVGAHGSALGRERRPGWTWGCLSNAVLSLDVLAWDPERSRYRVRTVSREDPGAGALLVHGGRAFVAAATLQVGPDVNLRCRSLTDVPAAEAFAPPGTEGERSLRALAGSAGRVEATWFPHTSCPWIRVWSEAPERPGPSRPLAGPYPFPFANRVRREDSEAAAAALRRNPGLTPFFLKGEMAVVNLGLEAWNAWDVWGPSRYAALHVKPTTLRYHASGHAILCRSGDLQRVVWELWSALTERLEAFAARGLHPVNGPLDLRVTSLDRTGEVDRPGARPALLSPLRPRPDQPQWDCALWAEVLTLPGTPGAAEFLASLEAWMLSNYQGGYAAVRVEWAKGWAYGPLGPWTADAVLKEHIPRSYTEGYPAGEGFGDAAAALDRLDPGRILRNPFLDRLFP